MTAHVFLPLLAGGSVAALEAALGACGSCLYSPAATATPPVAYTIEAGSTSGGCTITAGTVSFVAAGTCIVDASQVGNASFAAAPQVQQEFVIPAPRPHLFSGDSTSTPVPVLPLVPVSVTPMPGLYDRADEAGLAGHLVGGLRTSRTLPDEAGRKTRPCQGEALASRHG